MNKYLVITGASQGIGEATAVLFLQQGWQVINLSRRPCPIKEVKSFPVDLSDETELEKSAKTWQPLLQNAEKIALVHNASFYTKDNILNLKTEMLRKSLEVNVIAATKINDLVLPYMQAGSAIIYIGSTLSEKAVSNAASYIISKHAVIGMMRATCQDLFAKPGIHTCCVCPGFTETEMMRAHQSNNPELVTALKQRVSANRLIQPEEMASLIHYCATHPVINGAVIHGHLGQQEY